MGKTCNRHQINCGFNHVRFVREMIRNGVSKCKHESNVSGSNGETEDTSRMDTRFDLVRSMRAQQMTDANACRVGKSPNCI